MNIGLVQYFVGDYSGNDMVLREMHHSLSKNNNVTIFAVRSVDPRLEIIKCPAFPFKRFGLFKQIRTIYHKDMKKQDRLIVLTGRTPDIGVHTTYYHQQMPSMPSSTRPAKYSVFPWNLYYKIFEMCNHDIHADEHLAVSDYLCGKLKEIGITAKTKYPIVAQIPKAPKDDYAVTICRIEPEKNLDFNLYVMGQFNYVILGSNHNNEYFNYIESNKSGFNKVIPNPTRETIADALSSARVYFSSSEETLGIAVIEAITAGCIPIVADNTANIETVPFPELRFENTEDARKKVRDAFDGKFDYLLPKLAESAQRFQEEKWIR